MGFNPADYDVKKLSEQSSSNFVFPTDNIPIIRKDTESDEWVNFLISASIFSVLPKGYLYGMNPSVSQTGSVINSITVEAGVARDSTNAVNIYAENPITGTSAALWGGQAKPTGTNIPVYILVSRRSESDRTAAVYLSRTNGGPVGVDNYSVAVGTALYTNNGTSESIKNVVGLYNPIISVQENDITPGTTPLANGKIILVVRPL